MTWSENWNFYDTMGNFISTLFVSLLLRLVVSPRLNLTFSNVFRAGGANSLENEELQRYFAAVLQKGHNTTIMMHLSQVMNTKFSYHESATV